MTIARKPSAGHLPRNLAAAGARLTSEGPVAGQPNARQTIVVALVVVVLVLAASTLLGFLAPYAYTTDQTYIVRPLVAAAAVLSVFTYVLSVRIRAPVFDELGFVYLVIAAAYTFVPAIEAFDGSPLAIPEALGIHAWRHVLFLSGVGVGYLAVRGKALPPTLAQAHSDSTRRIGPAVATLLVLMLGGIVVVSLLSAPVATYVDHYTRFSHLSWSLLRVAYLALMFKDGAYFVIFALMFSEYRKYKILIFLLATILVVYESVYSLGSRIESLTILLTCVCCYHYRVRPITTTRGVLYLFLLAVLFSGIGTFRVSNFNLDVAHETVATEGARPDNEFGAVFNTSLHLYTEREHGTLPPRDWPMLVYETYSWIPFVDHTKYNPLYWYWRNYFPNAVVPPQTMGIIADSAVWGGEVDLLVRSLLNGALFAAITRWFHRRRDKWWALAIYAHCYATCVMVLKYSVLYQVGPLVRDVLPMLGLTAVVFRLQRPLSRPIMRLLPRS